VFITFSSLFGLFTVVAPADIAHLDGGGSIDTLPSKNRQQYGFITDSPIGIKFLKKPVTRGVF